MNDRCRLLEWDTEHFGVRIARLEGSLLRGVDAPAVQQWCVANDIACLYFLATADDDETVRAAETLGAHLVDVRVTLSRDSRAPKPFARDTLAARSSVTEDIAGLVSIAEDGYRGSRFFYDRNFSEEKCRDLYRIWLKKSFHGLADEVRVATIDHVAVGFVTCHLRDDGRVGEIGLVGVRDDVRGQGVGGVLVNDALCWFGEQRTQRVTVATQGRNISAQRLYQANGFRSSEIGLWYHWWPR